METKTSYPVSDHIIISSAARSVAEPLTGAKDSSFFNLQLLYASGYTLREPGEPPDYAFREGDVVLAVPELPLGFYKEIETLDANLHPLLSEKMLVQPFLGVLGRRYATRAYTTDIVPDLRGEFYHVALGGVISNRIHRSVREVKDSTRVKAFLVVSPEGTPLNTIDLHQARCLRGLVSAESGAATLGEGPLEERAKELIRLANEEVNHEKIKVLLVTGSDMDVGKTTAAAALIRMALKWGKRPSFIKLTGTARTKDLVLCQRAGAKACGDFTQYGGYPSTFRRTSEELEHIFWEGLGDLLLNHGCNVVIIELADGVHQGESSAVLFDPHIRPYLDGVIACGGDAMSAFGVSSYLWQRGGFLPDAYSGLFANNPESWNELRFLLGTLVTEKAGPRRRPFLCFDAKEILESGKADRRLRRLLL